MMTNETKKLYLVILNDEKHEDREIWVLSELDPKEASFHVAREIKVGMFEPFQVAVQELTVTGETTIHWRGDDDE